MAQNNFSKIKLYGSLTQGAVPSPANLETDVNGVEVAINAFDAKMFIKNTLGAVVEIGQAGGGGSVTSVTGTAPISVTNNTTTPVVALTGNIPNTQITGLGTMSTQNANAVAITGGNATVTTLSATTVNADYVDNLLGALDLQSAGVTKLQITAGGVLVTQDPTQNLQVATKQYVDQKVIGGIVYKGLWNAATNTPPLASGVGVAGELYVVEVSGTTDLDGITNWVKNNWALFDGVAWQQLDAQPSVYSVNGQQGDVILNADNLPLAGDIIKQNASSVTITGGTVNDVVIGGVTPNLITGTIITGTQYVGISGGSFA
jgi:hypothetical protein